MMSFKILKSIILILHTSRQRKIDLQTEFLKNTTVKPTF